MLASVRGSGLGLVGFGFQMLIGIGLFVGLIATTGTVHICDKVRNAYQPVGGVPNLLVLVAGTTDLIERAMAEVIDDNTLEPTAKIECGAGGHAFNLFFNAVSPRGPMTDTFLDAAGKDYVRQCYPIARVPPAYGVDDDKLFSDQDRSHRRLRGIADELAPHAKRRRDQAEAAHHHGDDADDLELLHRLAETERLEQAAPAALHCPLYDRRRVRQQHWIDVVSRARNARRLGDRHLRLEEGAVGVGPDAVLHSLTRGRQRQLRHLWSCSCRPCRLLRSSNCHAARARRIAATARSILGWITANP